MILNQSQTSNCYGSNRCGFEHSSKSNTYMPDDIVAINGVFPRKLPILGGGIHILEGIALIHVYVAFVPDFIDFVFNSVFHINTIHQIYKMSSLSTRRIK